jgi:acyl-CoA thioesterase FadM
MPQPLITFQSAVPPWECDIVEHFTVAYYYEKLDFATAATLLAAGLDPTHPDIPVMTRCLTRYSAELRKGDTYHIETIALAPDKLGHRLINSASGTVCTHFEQTLSQALPGFEAGAEWGGPEQTPVEFAAEGPHWFDTGRDVMSAKDCNLAGSLSSSACIHRFSAASAHLKSHFGMTPAYMREQRIGFSTFGFDIRFSGSARPGMALLTQSCVAHIGRSSLRMEHRLIRLHDGVEICRLSQMGVHLDMRTRRPSHFPHAQAEAARAMLPHE